LPLRGPLPNSRVVLVMVLFPRMVLVPLRRFY